MFSCLSLVTWTSFKFSFGSTDNNHTHITLWSLVENKKTYLECTRNHIIDKITMSRSIQECNKLIVRLQITNTKVNGHTSFSLCTSEVDIEEYFFTFIHDPCILERVFSNLFALLLIPRASLLRERVSYLRRTFSSTIPLLYNRWPVTVLLPASTCPAITSVIEGLDG